MTTGDQAPVKLRLRRCEHLLSFAISMTTGNQSPVKLSTGASMSYRSSGFNDNRRSRSCETATVPTCSQTSCRVTCQCCFSQTFRLLIIVPYLRNLVMAMTRKSLVPLLALNLFQTFFFPTRTACTNDARPQFQRTLHSSLTSLCIRHTASDIVIANTSLGDV